jgi:hypothetical protein
MVRKLTEPSKVCVGNRNIGSLTGKLRELVDIMIRRRILFAFRRQNRRGKRQRK